MPDDPIPELQPCGSGDYIVQPGDGLSSIADAHGFFWSTLWELPDNAALKEARVNPEVLLPGDRVTIIEKRQKTVARPTGARHVFRRRGVPAKIRFQVRTRAGVVFAGCAYKLVADGVTHEGTTDSEGRIEHFVPPSVRTALLTVTLNQAGYPATASWELQVGQMEPAGSLNGVKARLRNLGYDVAQAGLGVRTTEALRAVQTRSGLEATGVLDDATRKALVTLHGS